MIKPKATITLQKQRANNLIVLAEFELKSNIKYSTEEIVLGILSKNACGK